MGVLDRSQVNWAEVNRKGWETRRRNGSENTFAILNVARRGIPLSIEHRAKQSASHKGRSPRDSWSDATKARVDAKNRDNRLGKSWPHTPEWNVKIGAAQKGKPRWSLEQRAAQSVRRKGQKRGPYTPEHCAAISAGKRGKKRAPFSEEWIARIAAGRKRQKPTSIERIVGALLSALEITYVTEYQIGRYHVDFYVVEKNLVIECDGDYWHGSEEAQASDRKRDDYLRERGYHILRLPEHQIHSGGAAVTLKRVLCEVA